METILSATSHHARVLHPLTHTTDTSHLYQSTIPSHYSTQLSPNRTLLHWQRQCRHLQRRVQQTSKAQATSTTQTPHVELAIRWWHTNHNYHHYSTIFLHSAPTYHKHGHRNTHSFNNTAHLSTSPTSNNIFAAPPLHSTSNPTSSTSHVRAQPHAFGAESAEQQHHFTGLSHLQKPASDNGTHSMYTTLPHTHKTAL